MNNPPDPNYDTIIRQQEADSSWMERPSELQNMINNMKRRLGQIHQSKVSDIGVYLLAQSVLKMIDLVEQDMIVLGDINLWLYGVRHSNAFGEHADVYALADEIVNMIYEIEGRQGI